MMSEARLAVPMFKNSLRRWQAEWKAQKAQAQGERGSAGGVAVYPLKNGSASRPRGVGQAPAVP